MTLSISTETLAQARLEMHKGHPKTIWFCRHEPSRKRPMVSFKTFGFVTTNATGNVPTSCEMHLVLVATVSSHLLLILK